MNRRIYKTGLVVALIATLSMLPFLGMTEFHTKGEPREAIVAMTMLQDDNWILPMNNGGEMAYKPPFLHWCIAVLYLITGQTNEYLSRLPSALAFIGLVVATFFFFTRHGGWKRGLLAALLAMTAFELHRAGNVCRVDMLLTTFVVTAIYSYYNWFARQCRGCPIWAVLLMSAGTLTKGPVAIILPTMVIGVYLLLFRRSIGAILKVAACTILALVLPALWYWAAYQRGGEAFMALVMEENVGRFTGQMTYSSHEKPVWYNFMTLVWGWLPWTALFIGSLFALPKGTLAYNRLKEKVSKWRQVQQSITCFSWLAFLLILLFYCIPTSKRSTYLLPCYPFIAFLLADYVFRLKKIIREKNGKRNIAALSWKNMKRAIAVVVVLFMVADGIVVPAVVKKRYDRPLANFIATTFPNDKIYSHLSDPYMHFFCTNFYLHDRIRPFTAVQQTHVQRQNKAADTPNTGLLMVAEKDLDDFMSKYGKGYQLDLVYRTPKPMTERRSVIRFYKFKKRSTK